MKKTLYFATAILFLTLALSLTSCTKNNGGGGSAALYGTWVATSAMVPSVGEWIDLTSPVYEDYGHELTFGSDGSFDYSGYLPIIGDSYKVNGDKISLFIEGFESVETLSIKILSNDGKNATFLLGDNIIEIKTYKK